MAQKELIQHNCHQNGQSIIIYPTRITFIKLKTSIDDCLVCNKKKTMERILVLERELYKIHKEMFKDQKQRPIRQGDIERNFGMILSFQNMSRQQVFNICSS
ncbi:hypothetical protein pb186bvf_019583 [Paramecium bursaria]